MKFKNPAVTKWVTLLTVALTGGVINKICYMRDLYYDAMQQATGATDVQLGLLMTAFGIVNFILFLPGGVLADKFSPKKLIVFSCFATSAAGFWYSTMPGFTILMLLHVIFAITTDFTFWAAMIKIVNNLGGPSEQGSLIGSLEASRGLFGTVVAIVSVFFFSRAGEGVLGLKATVVFYSVVLVVAGILAALFIAEPELPKKNAAENGSGSGFRFRDVLAVIRYPRVWNAGIMVCMSYSACIFAGMLTPYLTAAFGLSGSTVAVLSTIRTYVMMMVGSLAAGILADKTGSVIRFMKYGFLGMAIFSAGYLMIPANRSLVWLIVLNFILCGLCLYSVKALYFATIDEMLVPKRYAGTASGIISLIGYSPEIFMYVWVGKIVENGAGLSGYHSIFRWMVGFSLAGCFCAVLLTYLVKRAKEGKRAEVLEEGAVGANM